MKLSEALRTGMEGQTQIQRDYFRESGECCAVGAVLRTIDPVLPGRYALMTPMARTEWCSTLLRSHFFTEHELGVLGEMIAHNDKDGWTFQQIAEWLEGAGH